VQAADAAVRRALGLSGLADVRLVSEQDGAVRLATPAGEIETSVFAEEGPPVAESCGKAAVASVRYSVRW
jgi:hypothetical protein